MILYGFFVFGVPFDFAQENLSRLGIIYAKKYERGYDFCFTK